MRQTRQGSLWLVVFFLVFWTEIDAGQTATQLDKNFGENGFVVKDFGSGEDEIFAVAPQPDGKIVAVGQYDNGAVKNLAVARYLPTGELDPSFSDDGIFTHSIGTRDTRGRSVAIQADGKIIVAGAADDGQHNIVLVRLTADGLLDNSFAANGQQLLPVTDGEPDAWAVRLTAEGAILVAGTVVKNGDAGTYGLVAKVTADGQPDPDFGSAGMSLLKYDYDVEIRALVLLADGRMVAAGSFAQNGTAQAGLLRLAPNGTIDTQFGQDGRSLLTLTDIGSIAHGLTQDAGGNLYLAGEVNNGNFREAFVAALTQDGALVPGFGGSGIYRSRLAAENVGRAIALGHAGNLLVAGFVTTGQGKDVFLLTIGKKTGPDDPAAGDDNAQAAATAASAETELDVELITADLAHTTDVGNALAVMPDGAVIVAGATGLDGNLDFALLRFAADTETRAVAGSTANGKGVSTAGYTLLTRRVTEITRVGAQSGGTITDYGTRRCADACTATCSTNADPATCFTSCFATCQLPTVSQRGVVFGIASSPVYRTDTDTDTDTTTDTSTDTTTDTSTDTTTDTTSSGVLQATDEVSTFPASETFAFDIVETGQTEDGSGTGSYGSIIQGITPNTVYYVRAYALLSDGTVIYGNEQVFRTDDACFVATAAFGSILDQHVAILREFRDTVMLTGGFGKRLVSAYYKLSPRLADLIEKYEVLRSIVRVILIPLVLMAYFILKTGPIVKICVLTAFICFWPLRARLMQL